MFSVRDLLPARMPRDGQRSRVYAWEAQLPTGCFFGMGEATDLIRDSTFRFGVPMPTVALDRRRRARPKASPGKVWLPFFSLYEKAVLHECSHVISPYFQSTEPWHGPTFMRIYITLLCDFMGMPERKLLFLAEQEGIEVAKERSCKPIPRATESVLRREIARRRFEVAMSLYEEISRERRA